MKILLVAGVLVMVTFAVVAVAATNWYDYGALNADRGVTAERGWEPFIVEDIGGREYVFLRRPRLRIP
jgi:hypothetical protein